MARKIKRTFREVKKCERETLTFSVLKRVRMLPCSLSTRSLSCSLFWQLRMSLMKTGRPLIPTAPSPVRSSAARERSAAVSLFSGSRRIRQRNWCWRDSDSAPIHNGKCAEWEREREREGKRENGASEKWESKTEKPARRGGAVLEWPMLTDYYYYCNTCNFASPSLLSLT